jgi:hypothetical protein
MVKSSYDYNQIDFKVFVCHDFWLMCTVGNNIFFSRLDSLDNSKSIVKMCTLSTGEEGSATWYTSHVSSTVLTTVLCDPFLF